MTKSIRTMLAPVGGPAGLAVMALGTLAVGGLFMLRHGPQPAAASTSRTSALAPDNPPADAPAMPGAAPKGPGTPPALDLGQRLTALEAGKEFVTLSTLLFDDASGLSRPDALAAINWLGSRRASPSFPALFLETRLHETLGNLDEAARTYVAASVVGRIDAARCADRSAASAVSLMESRFREVKAYLRANDRLARDAMRQALVLEETLRERRPAAWIAMHGLEASGGKPARYLADADWLVERERMRTSLARSIAPGR